MKANNTGPDTAPFDVRGAIWTLIRTDFKVRYHGTVMGLLWAMLKPLAMFGVLMGVFGVIFGSTPDYALNLVLGIFLYSYFSDATAVGLISLHQKGYLLSKSLFPRWILVVTATTNALLTLTIASVAIIVYLAAVGRFPGLVGVSLYLVYLAHYVVIVTGFSLAASVLFLRYRDLNQVWDVVAQAGFFFAPVIYPLEILPEQFHRYLYIWPPTPVIQFARAVLIGSPTGIPTLKAHGLLAVEALVCLVIGIVVHRRMVPRAAEYL